MAGVLCATFLATAVPVVEAADPWPYWYTGSGNEKWCYTPYVWNNVGNWPEYVSATDVAIALWNSAPIGRSFGIGSSSVWDIKVIQYNDPWTTAYGYGAITSWWDAPTDPRPYCFKKGEVGYNAWYRGLHGTVQQHIYRAVHELGHELNMGHFASDTDIMYKDTSPWNRGIWHPTFETVEALRTLYGPADGTFGLRSVLGNAGAGPSGTFPSSVWTNAATGKNYAMAYQQHTMTGSQKGMMVYAVARASTLHRLGVGFYAGLDPTDQTKRMSTIEIDNDGIKSVVTNTAGGSRIAVLAPAVANTDYWVEAVMPRMGTSNTYWSTNCAWRLSDRAFLGCGASQTSEIGYGNPPATAYGAITAFTTTGAANSYTISRGNTRVY